ncbi:hypothetical protein [Lichenibacterium ramalinae]|uniref:Uncharacterized protein n=1 Tax=Lichenibacterium ramalinae TaxID=2316527 RepID=A0A4Q2RDC3_9HYPH|nr:hypothetical protein [Lichenibacterium ramalinae]RYB04323.1 hypothetical protein D3272_12745 [Lichenibacterium ramalinae]
MTVYLPSPNVAVARPRPAGDVVRIAAFSCRGLEVLSRRLGFPVAVVAAVPDPERHRERLRDLWYASGAPMGYGDWVLPFDFDNWDYREWSRQVIDPRWFGGGNHPLSTCVMDGDLLLRLPPGIPPRAYSDAFRDRLAPLRFEAVASRPSYVVRMHHARRPVTVASRYARASTEDLTAVEVRDLVHFEPRCLTRIADMALAALRDATVRTGVGAETPGPSDAVAS